MLHWLLSMILTHVNSLDITSSFLLALFIDPRYTHKFSHHFTHFTPWVTAGNISACVVACDDVNDDEYDVMKMNYFAVSIEWIMSGGGNDTNNQTKTNVADAVFDKTARLIVLYVQIVLGIVGGTLVFIWLWIYRRRTSRVNTIIRNLACADMLVISFACVMQVRTNSIEWSPQDRPVSGGLA